MPVEDKKTVGDRNTIAEPASEALRPESRHLADSTSVDKTASHLRLGDIDPPTADDRTAIIDSGAIEQIARRRAGDSSSIRYQLLHSHARGGLGEVFIARDRELPRDVVLKEIQSQHLDDPTSIERFVLEAEITGSLEHPGIVPIYGFGHYSDGRPFYAMRFIRGETLGDAIRRFHEKPRTAELHRDVQFRDLIQRFVAVCQAVEFAHRRGVIHRDLKPSNIMLGEFGETLVVDWGLAKRLGTRELDPLKTLQLPRSPTTVDPSNSPTASGAVLGTPNYMSPEQAAGATDEVAPASDIYSLGATFYVLLTGRTPIEDRELPILLAKVQRGEFPSPRQVDSRVPAALNAICLKAMRLLPELRYRSCREFADDLQSWLADEPVTAHAEPRAVRAARWIRRHRTLVTTLAVSVALAAVLATTAAFFLNAARHSEHMARQQAETNEKRALLAEAQAAEQFRQARKAVDDSFTEISENPFWLRQTPGSQELRRRLLERAKDYYERFVREKSDDPAVQAETANAFFRLGKVQRELSPASANIDLFEKSIAIWQRMVDLHPDDRGVALNLASARNAVGRIQMEHGRIEAAKTAFDAARRLADPTAATDADAALESADALLNLGTIEGNAGRFPGGVKLLQAACDRLEKFAVGVPSSSDRMSRPLAETLSRLSYLLQQNDKLDDAEKAILRAIGITKRLRDANPTDGQIAASLGNRLVRFVEFLSYCGRRPESLKVSEEAVEIFDRLSQENPHVVAHRRAAANARIAVAFNLLEMNRFDDARAQLDKAVAQLQLLIQKYPDVIDFRIDLGALYNTIGEYYGRTKRREESLGYYERSIEELAKVLAIGPRYLPAERSMHYAHMNRVIRCLEDKRPDEALHFLELRLHAKVVSEIERGVCRHWRAYVWAHGDDYERGVAEASELAGDAKVNAEQFYNLACVLSIASSTASTDNRVSVQQRTAASDRIAKRAVELLDKSRQLGFFAMAEGKSNLKTDVDLDPLRKLPEFKKLVEEVGK